MANEHLLKSNNPFVLAAHKSAEENRLRELSKANPQPMNPLLKKALDAAKSDKPVVPCGPDRKPLTPNGWDDATTDFQMIHAMWLLWPDAIVGIKKNKEQDQ